MLRHSGADRLSDEIFEKMRLSPLTALVGGGDPRAVGKANVSLLDHLIDMRKIGVVLDYGCGVGRTATALLQLLREDQRLIGIDILPQLIKFCRDEIGMRYSNVDFFCTDAGNPHYLVSDDTEQPPILEQSLIEQLSGRVDLLCAFSIVTHMSQLDICKFCKKLHSYYALGAKRS